MKKLDVDFWDTKHAIGDTPWQLDQPSPPIIAYLSQIQKKDLRILIPGAGQGYELDYLLQNGFTDVLVCDLSSHAIERLKDRVGDNPSVHYYVGDFFDLRGKYDLGLEQTFFCALNPELRLAYLNKMHEILNVNGKLVGLLFASEFPFEGPPFGGDINAYKSLFEKKLHIKTMNMCYNSVKPRLGNELFFICQKIIN